MSQLESDLLRALPSSHEQGRTASELCAYLNSEKKLVNRALYAFERKHKAIHTREFPPRWTRTADCFEITGALLADNHGVQEGDRRE